MNGLQAAWQYTFSPQSGTANPTFVSTLTLTTSFAAPLGSYVTTVRATDQSGHFVEGNAIIVVAQTTVTQATTTTTPPTTTLSAKCIIATAAYGSEMAPEVVYMRYVRDNLIGSTPTGKVLRDAFNTFYYSWSPPIAQAIAGNAGLQALFRILLLPLVGIIHATAWVFMTLGAGDLASIAAFTIAAALTITVYIVTPTFAILLTYKESKALLVSPSDST
jgi:peptide/nickel transport system substrate-binding protein